MVEHRSVSNYLSFAARTYLKGPIVGGVVSTPLGFDATLTTLFGPLMVGKSVLLLSEEATLSELAKHAFESRESWLFKLTPAHLQALEHIERDVEASEIEHCLVIGGEQLSLHLVSTWKSRLLPKARFINEYGPTEAVVGCSFYEITDLQVLENVESVPIGRPIDNTQLYVLSEKQQMLPLDSVGELCIGGAGVTRGYLNREQLTREKFIDNPYRKGERLYRSGDRVRWSWD